MTRYGKPLSIPESVTLTMFGWSSACQNLGLPLETLAPLRHVSGMLLEHLDRDQPTDVRILGPVDKAHPTLSQSVLPIS